MEPAIDVDIQGSPAVPLPGAPSRRRALQTLEVPLGGDIDIDSKSLYLYLYLYSYLNPYLYTAIDIDLNVEIDMDTDRDIDMDRASSWQRTSFLGGSQVPTMRIIVY